MQESTKPGILTTEFWGAIISMGVSVAVLFKVIPAEQAQTVTSQLNVVTNAALQVITALSALYIAVAPLIKYIESRTTLKKTFLEQQGSKAQA